jgi:hypothetical protein
LIQTALDGSALVYNNGLFPSVPDGALLWMQSRANSHGQSRWTITQNSPTSVNSPGMVIDPASRRLSYVYDFDTNPPSLKRVVDYAGRITTLVRDTTVLEGGYDFKAMISPDGQRTSMTYSYNSDFSNPLTSLTTPDGQLTRYNEGYYSRTIISPIGHRSTFTIKGLYYGSELTDPRGYVTTFTGFSNPQLVLVPNQANPLRVCGEVG